MSRDFPERDWKVFQEVRATALERFCDRILTEIARIAEDAGSSAHERYVVVYQLVKDRDVDMAGAFNDHRRSTALRQLAMMHSLDVLSADELARFSAETQASVKELSEMCRPRMKSARN